MLRVTIESPYAGFVERNTDYARRCLRHSIDLGEAPFASHLLYTQPNVLDDSIATHRARGIQAGYEWMHAADLVAFYCDYGWSEGMRAALNMAALIQKKISVRYILSVLHNHDEVTPREVLLILEKWPWK